MSGDLWGYSETIGRRLASDPAATAVREAFAFGRRLHPGRQARTGWRGALDQALSMFGSQMRAMPLQVSKYLAYVPMIETIAGEPGGRRWLESAEQAANTQHARIELLRSRLPGYPFLRVPYLLPAGPLGARDVEFGSYLWDRGVRRMRLQFLDTLPDADPQIEAALNGLAKALSLTADWEQFSHARSVLDTDDKAALAEAGRWMTQTIDDEGVEEIRSLLARNAARHGVANRAVARLPDRSREYCLAFVQLNSLIDSVMATAERLSVFGGPDRLPAPARVYLRPTWIEARWEADFMDVDLGAPVILEGGILAGVLRTEGYTSHFGKGKPGVFKARLSIYGHSRAWWERETAKR